MGRHVESVLFLITRWRTKRPAVLDASPPRVSSEDSVPASERAQPFLLKRIHIVERLERRHCSRDTCGTSVWFASHVCVLRWLSWSPWQLCILHPYILLNSYLVHYSFLILRFPSQQLLYRMCFSAVMGRCEGHGFVDTAETSLPE